MGINVIDYILRKISPRLVLQRDIDKYMLNQFRKFEGASTGSRLADWAQANISNNDDILFSLRRLRARSSDLYKNNPWARKIISIITTETIRTGCLLTPASKREGHSHLKSIVKCWENWSETRSCDYNSKAKFYSMQKLIFKTVVEEGECLVLRRYEDPTPLSPTGLKIQILGPEFLDVDFNTQLDNGNTIYGGIEFDGTKVVAYHIFKNNPNSLASTERVRILEKNLLLVFKSEYTGQIRGIPWLSPVLIKLRDLDLYEDAQLTKQKVSSYFTGFIYENGSSSTFSDIQKKAHSEISLEPGTLKHLSPGEEVKFSDPPKNDGYSDYVKQILHAVAAGVNIPYIALTSDMSEVNYSSFRGTWLEFNRVIDVYRDEIVISQISDRVFEWFLESMVQLGYDTADIYPVHTPPKREMIDPTRETDAGIKAIRAGMLPWSEYQRSQGKNPNEILKQLKEDADSFDKYGLVLDCDSRKVTAAGIYQINKEDINGKKE